MNQLTLQFRVRKLGIVRPGDYWRWVLWFAPASAKRLATASPLAAGRWHGGSDGISSFPRESFQSTVSEAAALVMVIGTAIAL